MTLPLGPLMINVEGLILTAEDKTILQDPRIGGLILFARNFESKQQLKSLISNVRQIRPNILIAVDHEGGRVQRFRKEFTALPPMGEIGKLYETNPKEAIIQAKHVGKTIANELQEVGIDFSFVPVLDLDKGKNAVIADRAFSNDPNIVNILSNAVIQGLRNNGMASIAKHFPGHGDVTVDSHIGMPVDERIFDEISKVDLLPFKYYINENCHGKNCPHKTSVHPHASLAMAEGECASSHYLDADGEAVDIADFGGVAVMPAHIVFPNVDPMPVGFSHFWLQDILRRQLGFEGAIISDDLSMEGARVAGDKMIDRVNAAINAGCDMVLVCNDREALLDVLKHDIKPLSKASQLRLDNMRFKIVIPA